GCEKDQAARRHAGLARAFNQEGMPSRNCRDSADQRIKRADKRKQQCKRTKYVQAASVSLFRPRQPQDLRFTAGRSRTRRPWRFSWSCFIFRCALRLNMFRDEFSVRTESALNQRLGIVHERVRQRIVSRVAHRGRVSRAKQNEIGASRNMLNAAGLDRSSHTDAVGSRRTVQRADFRNGVVVRLAFAVSKPGEKRHRHDNYRTPNRKFRLFLHGEHLYAFNWQYYHRRSKPGPQPIYALRVRKVERRCSIQNQFGSCLSTLELLTDRIQFPGNHKNLFGLERGAQPFQHAWKLFTQRFIQVLPNGSGFGGAFKHVCQEIAFSL